MSLGWLVRTASRPQDGAGHVSRSRVLARALARLAPTTLALDGEDWRLRLAGEPFAVLTAETAPEGPLAGAVVDHYDLPDGEWAGLRKRAGLLAQLDDFLAPRPEVDLAINAALHLEGCRLDGRAALLGPAFALVEPRYDLPDRPTAERVRSILVGFGALDSVGATGLALDALARARLDARVVVAMGGRAPHLEEVRRQVQRLGGELLVDATDLTEALASADLAVGAGGVSLLERLAAGVPTIGLAVADNQRVHLEGAQAMGATRFVGAIAETTAERLAGEIAALARDSAARDALRVRGRSLVDGRGGERVAQALIGAQAARMHEARA